MENNYIGITIGPIGDAMSVSTKPAALWAASMLFSFISKQLCLKINEKANVAPDSFVVPYFPDVTKEEEKDDYHNFFERTDGLGLFHDHIIFKEVQNGKSFNFFEKFPEIYSAVIQMTAETFVSKEDSKDFEDFLKNFVLIAPARISVEENENVILKFGKILDSLELAKPFNAKSFGTELAEAFENFTVKKNIKDQLGVDDKKWQLIENTYFKGDSFKSIPDIAHESNAKGLKLNEYYGILRCDGDKMSKVLGELHSDKHLRAFSKTCFSYCIGAAELVKAFGGMTIYAGGDDLFALVPCRHDNKSVFSLICDLRECFQKEIGKFITDENISEEIHPTLSCGLFISYQKFPLYEAVERSGELLFGIAKNTEEKNCVVVELQKHSGQSSRLILKGKNDTDDLDAIAYYAEQLNGLTEKQDEVLLSALHKIGIFSELFDHAERVQIKNVFVNTFDAPDQNEFSDFLHKTLPEILTTCCCSGKIVSQTNGEKSGNANTLESILRIMKFYVEKAGEEAIGGEQE